VRAAGRRPGGAGRGRGRRALPPAAARPGVPRAGLGAGGGVSAGWRLFAPPRVWHGVCPVPARTSHSARLTPGNPMSQLKFQEKRRPTLWIVLAVLPVATIGLSVWLMGPSPPRRIVFATGQEGGGYDTFGQRYKANLGKMGLRVQLVNTNGSIDNLQRLLKG